MFLLRLLQSENALDQLLLHFYILRMGTHSSSGARGWSSLFSSLTGVEDSTEERTDSDRATFFLLLDDLTSSSYSLLWPRTELGLAARAALAVAC